MSEVRKKIQSAAPVIVTEISASPYFEFVKNKRVTEILGDKATISIDFLGKLMSPLLSRIKFDAAFYRQRYEDLAEAEAKGLIVSLHDHYLRFGYFENRMPCLVEVDGSFYARECPDVAVAILESRVASAQSHFEASGFVEGRLPRKGWTFADLLEA